MPERFLLADVGASNTRVGLGGAQGLDTNTVASFRNRDHAGLIPLLRAYLDTQNGPVTAICAGVAGPVRAGSAQLTNHNWHIDAAELTSALSFEKTILINDLQAQGFALDDLPACSVTPVFTGATPPPGATRLVLGLGTGSNIAVVHQRPDGLFVPPSETGHTSLPHLEGDAQALIRHLAETHYHKPMEAALSGPGLSRIYRFVCGETADAPAILTRYAEGDEDAGLTLRLFAEILGTVAGDIALCHLPMGGIFLIGGLARAVAPHLDALQFHDHFVAKGPYTPIVRDIPIFLIDDDSAALHGCARCLRQDLG